MAFTVRQNYPMGLSCLQRAFRSSWSW